MCGINGIFAFNRSAGPPSERELIATRDYMSARGPDGAGDWWSEDRRLGLGHRRLAIIDLSPRGAQPMTSACGRYAVTYNGEIYNFPELRRSLEAQGRVFQSSSDTEALLHLYAIKGEAMVRDLRGMFAFAIWDTHARTLFLARDPYGIKPLYTSCDGWTFRFASQVKALLAGGKVSLDPEPAGIVGFHLWGSVPEPFTLYRDIRALPAGHTQLVDAAGPREPKPYASIAGIIAAASASPAPASETASRVRDAARESVAAHLLADVEVGVFLSAGIDSGSLLGLMRDAGQTKIRAITLTFEELQGSGEDEAPLAADVARLYGAEHTVRSVSRKEFEDDYPEILNAMDQPSIDGVNTWFVSKATREAGLKVALSGLGGDEILAGYPSFSDVPRWTRRLSVPAAMPGLGRAARFLGSAFGLARRQPKLLGLIEYGGSYPGAYLLRRGLFLPHELSDVLNDPSLVEDGLHRLAPLSRVRGLLDPAPTEPLARVAVLESAQYMRNQLLRDADWAGMAHSLEIRTPLVDTHFASAVSPSIARFANRQGKRALAQSPSVPLPAAIAERAKTGFIVPTQAWMAHRLDLGATADATKGQVSRALSRAVFGAFNQVQPPVSPTHVRAA
ncbi:MAG: asparagine synthase (glutamine-hydrolyzing) [Hyphomonadaceae bacterium]